MIFVLAFWQSGKLGFMTIMEVFPVDKKHGKYGTDGIRNNQAMPDVPEEQWDHGATDGIDDVVEEVMDELEESIFGHEKEGKERKAGKDEDEKRDKGTLGNLDRSWDDGS